MKTREFKKRKSDKKSGIRKFFSCGRFFFFAAFAILTVFSPTISNAQDASDVMGLKSTGPWYNTSTFTFVSDFGNASCYRYKWDTNATYTWQYDETTWTSGDLNFYAASENDTWYLHVLPYINACVSGPGTARHMGPFRFDETIPTATASSYKSISSTGGAMSESQFNDLTSGVTVQINVQDSALSGLMISTTVAPGEAFAGPGGFGAIYSKDAGQTWQTGSEVISFAGDDYNVYSLAVYDGKLYAGEGYFHGGAGQGDIHVCSPGADGVCDTGEWGESHNEGTAAGTYALAVFRDKLYAGQGSFFGDSFISVYDGSNWNSSFTRTEDMFWSLAVYNDKLYAGLVDWSAGNGDIWVCTPETAGDADTCDDATDWTLSYGGAQESIYSLAVYNGRLYAGQGRSGGDGDIFVCDPGVNGRCDDGEWTKCFEGLEYEIRSLVVYNGKLYAAQAGTTAGDGDIYVCEPGADGVCSETGEWSKSYDGALRYIVSLGVYNGQLYAGQGGSEGEGDILVCNPETAGDSGVCDDNADWSKTYDGAQEYIYSIAAFNGKLYAGQGYSSGDGDVFEFTPVAVSSMTGIDGTTSEQTLYALAEDFAASTNSETCGGSYSCGATNQMVFSITDRAGNVNMSGPYAVITAPNIPNVDDVIGRKSTGSWYNTNAFIYTSTTNFDGVGYYLYEWNTSATHSWTENEPAWNSGELSFDAVESNRYLHILPYNVAESSDTGRHLGPYGFDVTLPIATVSSFRSISSTDGAMSESQFNDLTSGVTVQINVQDILSGLMVSTTLAPGEALFAPGGFSVKYSTDEGQTWQPESSKSISFDGDDSNVYSLAVYEGKLYAGEGSLMGAGTGDIHVCDPGADGACDTGDWSESHNDAVAGYTGSFAVYKGNLYAGQGKYNTVYGDVWVFNGASWAKSFEGVDDYTYALAVYNDKLYMGQGDQSVNSGNIYVCDPGVNGICDTGEWTLVFESGERSVFSLAVYNGRLYAGQGGTIGASGADGDIYVCDPGYDGICDSGEWTKSFEGAENEIHSMVAYNGKLYAAQGGYNLGDGDIYVCEPGADGVCDTGDWTKSFEGATKYMKPLAVYNGRLYAGQGRAAGDGDIWVCEPGSNGICDTTEWNKFDDSGNSYIHSFAAFNGKLYMGQGNGVGDGDVLEFTPTTVSSMTGVDGSTDPETLYAVIDSLAASTKMDICEGESPCTANNQVVFTVTDRAGNINRIGPYAVLTPPPPPDANAVNGAKSTGSWHNTSTFTFISDFANAYYYLYKWNQSATYSWPGGEDRWDTGESLSFEIASEGGADWYLHVAPYNIADSSGTDTDRHIGPFSLDVTSPTVIINSFQSISSTDGAMAESQFNDLTSGVTVQISVQDVLAGLVVSSTMTPGEAIAAPGGFGAIYSKDAGQTWSVEDMSISYDGAENIIYSLVVYNDRLYAGQGNGNGYVYVSSNGINWSTSFEGAQEYIHSLAVFNGKLYAGESGNTAGDGDIYVCNPETAGDSTEVCDHADDWTKSFDGDQEEILSIASYAGKLYAGQGRSAGDGDIYVCDPGANGVCDLGEWTKSFEGGAYKIHSLAVYNSGFYAGQGKTDSTLGDIYVSTDGINWNISHNGDKHGFYSLAVYNDKLYAGQGNDYNYDSGGAGDIYVFDGTNWELSYDGENSKILSLAVFNGQLYAGEHGPHSNHPAYTGDIMSFDGTSWSQNYEGEQEIISSLATFNGNLYAGQGDDTDEGDVLKFTPTVVSTMTGTDGSTSVETLSVVINEFSASTNVETCGGSYPCGATNQVIFNYTDRAGNIKKAGPYAVISVTPPDADDISALKSTGSWYNTSSFTFVSDFGNAAYYLYAWDTSATYSWPGGETQWSGGVLELDAVSGDDNRYLHIQPYNIADSSGTDTVLHFGPFKFDISYPSPSSFKSFNSVSAAKNENETNDLILGVTVQITIQDTFSGLMVSSTVMPGEAFAAPGGFSVKYSKDAGQTWLPHSGMSKSYEGPEFYIHALAVFRDKFYAGQGGNPSQNYTDGGVHVCDPGSDGICDTGDWSESYGAQDVIYSLAVFNDKLYAGQGNDAGDADIFVCNPETAGVSTEVCDHADDWTNSYNGEQESILSLAAYNGSLYAGLGEYNAGDGVILVSTNGVNWATSYNGAREYIHALAVYNGKLYAGQGSGSGAGDVLVCDPEKAGEPGVCDNDADWSISYNGDYSNIHSLAVYNGKLYAGENNTGDVLVFDGTNWSVSYSGSKLSIRSLAVYNGKLYAGQGDTNAGDIYVFDGINWTKAADGEQDAISALAAFNGELYAGQGISSGDGDVLRFTPTEISTMTGIDGSINAETHSAVIEEFAASTNTTTCGGSGPCGATNQVMFNITDRSGNVKTAGPYAVITAPTANADDVDSCKAGSWYNTSTFSFTSNFSGAAYYLYKWDQSATYAWPGGESQWNPSATLSFEVASQGDNWYLHVKSYNISNIAGASRDMGPFGLDLTSPTASSYQSISSTGGVIFESQLNDLALGVTVQISVRDELYSGLLVSTAGAPGEALFERGFGVTLSKDAGQNWVSGDFSLSHGGAQSKIYSLASFNDRLYAGQNYGDILVFGGTSWGSSGSGSIVVYSLAVYNGKLYAGSDNYIYVCNPETAGASSEICDHADDWTKSYTDAKKIYSLAVYNGKLYAGNGNTGGAGDVLVCDSELTGDTDTCGAGDWSISFDGDNYHIASLAVYNGKLYAGQGNDYNDGSGDIYVFDGTNWELSHPGAKESIRSLAVYNGKLYAGQGGDNAGNGDVLVFTEDTGWDQTPSYDGLQEGIYSLAVYNGKLYAGQGISVGDGDIYEFDGTSWSLYHGADEMGIYSLAVYDGNLYAGQGGNAAGDGDIFQFEPLAVSTMTGSDGTNSVQTFSALIDFASSTNTETCGGAYPCGATNQMIFKITDRAGNVKTFGPYAIIAAYTTADDVISVKSIDSWYNTSTFTFTSSFASADYYRYVWNTSSNHTWIETETIWNSGAVSANADTESGNWHLHLLSYNIHDSSGAARDMGPFKFEVTLPTAAVSSFQSFNSTEGALFEAEFNDLLFGVTAQISVQDILSGLAVSQSYIAGDSPYATGNFGVMYSTDKGVTWLTEEMSVSYNEGAQEGVYSLAVYDGKLYAGLGGGAEFGDIYEFDGTSWSISYNGGQDYIYSLAVYDGKLYAGQGGADSGDGDILVFDGAWSLHYGGEQEGFYSLAVYNDELYAGQGSATGGGDIYSFDGSTWTINYNGDHEIINCLAAYNGKLYAGQGTGAGDGDVFVSSDGVNWEISYEGDEENINSFAFYNGKLYAGQGGALAGDGDVLVFTDGTGWNIAYNGARKAIYSIASYNGKLYAGQGEDAGDGDVLVSTGTNWILSYNGEQETIYSLAVYDGSLYAGQGNGASDGDVLKLTPLVLAMTGTDGTNAPQIFSANGFDLGVSSTSQTCGGDYFCGETTNQVIFSFTDRAGNVKMAGPYAIIVTDYFSWGLKIHDGTGIVEIALTQPSNSKLKIKKGPAVYGIKLVDDDAPLKSKIRIQVPSGIKNFEKYDSEVNPTRPPPP